MKSFTALRLYCLHITATFHVYNAQRSSSWTCRPSTVAASRHPRQPQSSSSATLSPQRHSALLSASRASQLTRCSHDTLEHSTSIIFRFTIRRSMPARIAAAVGNTSSLRRPFPLPSARLRRRSPRAAAIGVQRASRRTQASQQHPAPNGNHTEGTRAHARAYTNTSIHE